MPAVDWPMLCLCLFGSIAAGLLIFHVTAGYYHVRYYVLRRDDAASWKCQPNRWLRPEQQREAALLSSFNMTLGGTITGFLIYAMTQGWETPVYLTVGEYGWTYTILSTIGLFVANDAAAYYVHRALHFKPLFKRIHRHHHRYVATSPYVTTAVHPLELLALQTTSFLPLFFIPFWAFS